MDHRSGTCLLSAIIAMSCGCARPFPPDHSRIIEPQGLVHRFSSMPLIVVENQPTAPFRLSPEERQALEKAREKFNKAREERVSEIRERRMSGGNSPGAMAVDCVVKTYIIFSPLCIVIVPVAYGTGTLVEHGRASRSQPYVPALPSQEELSAAHQKVLSHVTATGIAYRLGTPPSDREGDSAHQFPRLVITPSFVTFGAERSFLIKFLVQGQPSADVTWPQTEHSYQVSYYPSTERLMAELSQGEGRLAESISTTYGLWAYGGPERTTANTVPKKAPRNSASYRPISNPGAVAGLPGVVEQQPRLHNHGCAPFNARVGNTYQRADGSRVAIARLLGETSACEGARPIAVEFEAP